MKSEETIKSRYSDVESLKEAEERNSLIVKSLAELEAENHSIHFTLTRLEEETAMLRELFNKANNELTNIKKPALLVAEVNSINQDKAIIKLPNGNKFYSYVAKEIKGLHSGDSVLVDQKSLNIVEKIEQLENSEVERFVIIEKPTESWENIGGLQREIQEIKEVIELPLKNP